jgi:hypothetical protein
MEKESDDKEKDSSDMLSIEKGEEEDFKEKVRAAYSAMGKLGGLARAKQLAEKGFRGETKPEKKLKLKPINKGEK